jgi:hypothetical protein
MTNNNKDRNKLSQFNDKRFDKDTPAPPSPDQEMRTEEEMRKDMLDYAEKNPFQGGLYLIDKQRALDKHAMRRSQASEAVKPAEPTQAGPIVKEWGYCRNHPFVKTNWRCTQCGREYCEDCVTPLRHFMSHLTRSAVCPECRGRCIDFRHIEGLDIERREKSKEIRTPSQIYVILVVLSLLLRTWGYGKVPIEFYFLLTLLCFVYIEIESLQWDLKRWFRAYSVFSDDLDKFTFVTPVIMVLALLFLIYRILRQFVF